MDRNQIEILSPVGSFESLRAAIQGGADAIYFGVEKLNMRSRSSVNFTMDDIDSIVRICIDNGIKSYLTLNVVIFDDEITLIKNIIDKAKESGVNAVIASDQSVISYANKQGLEVHISTQVNVSNIEAVRFYAQFADVMVLARELNLDQVNGIAQKIKSEKIKGPGGELVKLEIFIHGALCMAISGKCYLSLHHHQYAANRGACLQDCRRGYMVTDNETGIQMDIKNEYIMSPKDLCTIHFLNKIISAGARVLKIEGRARSPEYVKTVTRCYNDAVSSIISGDYNMDRIQKWKNDLATVFNRGFWDGYYLGQKIGEWSHEYGSHATRKKIYTARVTNYFTDINVAELYIETGEIKQNDEIVIIGPTTGVIESKVMELRVERKNVNKAGKGQKCSIPIAHTVRRSDRLYIMKDAVKSSLR